MTKKETGGPAFPWDEWTESDSPLIVNPKRHMGMTLRDYFAAKAPADLTTKIDGSVATYLVGRPMPEWKPYMDSDKKSMTHFEIECVRWRIELQSKLNFMYADAMLEARKK